MSSAVLPRVNASFPYLPQKWLFSSAIREAENNIQAPQPLICFSALTALLVALQGLYDVRKPNGQCVPTSVMLLSIAQSGERKSTTENHFMESINDLQRSEYISYQASVKKWESKLKIWNEKNKMILKAIGKKTEKGESTDEEEARLLAHEEQKPAKPKRFKIIYDDSTPEALFWGLNSDLSTTGLISSEGGSVLNGRALNDLPKFNAIWSGDSITVDRKTADSYELINARLTVSIMAQKSAFEEYVRRCGEKARGSGLWARFLVCHPESTQGSRFIKNGVLSWKYKEEFQKRLATVVRENLRLLDDASASRKVLEFSREAAQLWLDAFNEIESKIVAHERFDGLGDHASKLADNIARVAALLHVFEEGDTEISRATLTFAIDFCTWCSDDFYRLFMPQRQEISDAIELDEWLQKFREKGATWMPVNYIRQHGPYRLRSKLRLDAALKELWLDRRLEFCKHGKTKCITL